MFVFKKFVLLAVLTISMAYPLSLHAQEKSPEEMTPEEINDALLDYQHDMDIVRLRDLAIMGSYVEKYRKNTGQYPFAGTHKDGAVVAILATKEQRRAFDASPKPQNNDKYIFYNEFVAELERGLGEKIEFPFDPQRVPVNRQNFYAYMINDEGYFLAVHLSNAFPFAHKINDNWYKVEVSSKQFPYPLIWDYENLMENEQFLEAVNTELKKEGYVDELRTMIRNEVGF